MDMNQLNILVVEDNSILSKLTKRMFESLGCQVDLVGDGPEAVQLATTKRYDGISMDIGLPTMSGVDAIIAIRDYERKNNLSPVVIAAVTGNHSEEEVAQYRAVGMQDVIEKPLTPEKAAFFLSLCHPK